MFDFHFQSVKPSPAIRFNMANVLAAYAFIMRYFNGEVEPVETAIYVLDICTNLDSNTNFDDPELAVEAVAQRCLQVNYIFYYNKSICYIPHSKKSLNSIADSQITSSFG